MYYFVYLLRNIRRNSIVKPPFSARNVTRNSETKLYNKTRYAVNSFYAFNLWYEVKPLGVLKTTIIINVLCILQNNTSKTKVHIYWTKSVHSSWSDTLMYEEVTRNMKIKTKCCWLIAKVNRYIKHGFEREIYFHTDVLHKSCWSSIDWHVSFPAPFIPLLEVTLW